MFEDSRPVEIPPNPDPSIKGGVSPEPPLAPPKVPTPEPPPSTPPAKEESDSN